MLSTFLLVIIGAQFAMPVIPQLPESEGVLLRRHPVPRPLPADFPEILRRPIFMADRQPAIEPMDGIELLGTGSVGESYMALLKTGEQIVRVHAGDQISGWRIVGFDKDRVFFERDGEKRMLLLDLQRRRAATAPVSVPRSQ